MEVERSQRPSLVPTRAVRQTRAVAAPPPVSQSSESVACRVLFRRLPELLARMVSSSEEAGQVTLVFRLGYFDMAGLSQARKEFFEETQAGLRIMVEVPVDEPASENQAQKPTTQVMVNPTNLKRLTRRMAAQVRTERLDRPLVKTSTAGASTLTLQSEARGRPASHPSGNHPLTDRWEAPERRPLPPAAPRRWSQISLKEKKRPRPQAAPNWLRRREAMVAREERQTGPRATQNLHSAERQPYCLCPACGREMESTFLFCPECTVRAARHIQVPSRPQRSSASLIWLLSQAVSWTLV